MVELKCTGSRSTRHGLYMSLRWSGEGMSNIYRRNRLVLTVAGLATVIAAGIAYGAGVTTAYQYDETGNLLQVMDVSSDVSNCGGIGSVCAAPSNGYATCSAGTCGMACNVASNTVCGTQCIDLITSTSNCGACGHVCPAGPANSYPTCTSSTCGFECSSPYTKCGTYCVDTASDNGNCGGCGILCSATQTCSSGVCVAYNPCGNLKDCCGDGSICRSSCSPGICGF
jgi:hypothetical protein